MKEFYAEECGLDYGVMCYQDEIRQTVTKELLERVLAVEIIKFEIDFEHERIEYEYNSYYGECNLLDSILISVFLRECCELDDCND